jgi:transposase
VSILDHQVVEVAPDQMLRGRSVQQIYELHGEGRSIRAIAQTLGLSRNSVRKYLRSDEIPKAKARAHQQSKLEPFHGYVRQRLVEGVDNCVLLLRELRERGYDGGISQLKRFVHPYRLRPGSTATMRYETRPGEQAQVDFGYFTYRTPDGTRRQVYAFVMVLSWSRAIYVEFIRRADVATFIRCHLNAFRVFGGVPERCLYDNAKVVVLERTEAGEPVLNPRFLDFARRVGFGIQLCHPYRPQTKGRVESGIKYLRHNFWPGARFVDDADLNQLVQAWVDGVANQRMHGTTRERPIDRLTRERPTLGPLPARERLAPFLREDRRVGRDGYVQWERGWYGVQWPWAGRVVQVQADQQAVQIWAGDERLAVHPRATHPGQRFTLPGQWRGLERGQRRPAREGLAVQLPGIEVETRPLAVYEALVGGRL